METQKNHTHKRAAAEAEKPLQTQGRTQKTKGK